MPFLTMQYDVQNRMTQSVSTTNGTKLYAYAPSGSRVAQSAPPDPVYYQFNTWSITFYGPDGRRAADCSAAYVAPDPRYPQRLVLQASCDTVYVYFGGKLVRKEYKPTLQDGLLGVSLELASWGATLATDRLGSVQTGSKTTLLPLRRRARRHQQRHPEVRHLHPRPRHQPGLRQRPLLLQPNRQIHDGRPVPEQRRPRRPAELEPIRIRPRATR